nr:GST [Pagiophloeus tsushimanus]
MTHWSKKTMHGRHYNTIQQPHVHKELSYAWLRKGELHPETEGFTLAIQDQVIATRNYRKYIMKDPNINTDKCRKCQMFPETIDHVISGCKLLAGTEYVKRHDTAAKIIHQELALKHHLIMEKIPYYKYQPESVLENREVKLYWDTTIHTDRTMAYNRPDITYTLKKEKITYLIDVAIPNDANIKKKEEEKIEKYTSLAIEMKDLWKQQYVKIIPLIMSPTGITPLSYTENLQKINLHPSIHTQIQKAVILHTCNTVRKFLNPPV